MVDAIVLSVCSFLYFLIGASVGSYLMSKSKIKRIKRIKLEDGSKIHMWKGFVDPSLIYVYHANKINGQLDGDGVVFDKYGHIILVEKNVKKGCR